MQQESFLPPHFPQLTLKALQLPAAQALSDLAALQYRCSSAPLLLLLLLLLTQTDLHSCCWLP
jgi:hypothetical protein